MALQMGKVEQYSEWGNLKLNISKCAATGMPRQDMEQHATPLPMTKLGCDRLRQQLTAVKINGQPVPFAHPDSDLQRVLGVLITPSLKTGSPKSTGSWRKPDSGQGTSLNLMHRLDRSWHGYRPA